jgi:hypothetical protein
MDRKGQLGNVAFGGAWSERIPRNEDRARHVALVRAASRRTIEEDLRHDEMLEEALRSICATHPKGDELRRSWAHALCLENPGIRCREIERLARAITAWSPKTP